jgi:hypothetical protein
MASTETLKRHGTSSFLREAVATDEPVDAERERHGDALVSGTRRRPCHASSSDDQ